jgi:hypothetical protein
MSDGFSEAQKIEFLDVFGMPSGTKYNVVENPYPGNFTTGEMKYPPKSKALGQNPKDLLGVEKVSFTKVPAVAIAHCAHAMMDGAGKYGPYNWRDKAVVANIYIDAALRHLLDWFEGEEEADDSHCHHLGHAMACCAILLDAQETGNLVDNRPVNEKTKAILTKLLKRLNRKIKEKNDSQKVQVVGIDNPTTSK